MATGSAGAAVASGIAGATVDTGVAGGGVASGGGVVDGRPGVATAAGDGEAIAPGTGVLGGNAATFFLPALCDSQ